MRVSRAAILVALPISLSACDQQFAASQAGTSRYQLEKDNAGNLVRLDRETGEVRLLQQGKVIASTATPRSRVTASAESARTERASSPAVAPVPPSTSATRVEETPTSNPATAVEPRSPVTAVEPRSPVAAVEPRPAVTAGATVGGAALPAPHKNAVLMAAGRTPVFIRPGADTPLATLPGGTTMKYLSGSGQWFEIEFSDARWGRRVGYVDSSQVLNAKALEPVDLSVRPRPNALQPMDLSVPTGAPGAGR